MTNPINATENTDMINAAENTDLGNPDDEINRYYTKHTEATIKAYTKPQRVISSTDDNITVLAYPSSYWDNEAFKGGYKFRPYIVTWSKHVKIYRVEGQDYANKNKYVTDGYIDFNPKNTAEGELTIKNSGNGKYDDCDFSAITGFEKNDNYNHLSIYSSRLTDPEPA
jgi:hypothetical protein